MLGLIIYDFVCALGNLCKSVLKYALVMAVMLSPYAIDAALDKWLGNSLPPTCETEKSHE